MESLRKRTDSSLNAVETAIKDAAKDKEIESANKKRESAHKFLSKVEHFVHNTYLTVLGVSTILSIALESHASSLIAPLEKLDLVVSFANFSAELASLAMIGLMLVGIPVGRKLAKKSKESKNQEQFMDNNEEKQISDKLLRRCSRH